MKKIFDARIVSNECAVDNLFKLVVELDETLNARPGQFVQLKIPSNEFTLRRPLGIADLNRNRLTMFYRLVGRGTTFLSTLKPDTQLDLIAPLGNGFSIVDGEKVLLVGGGVGLAPLLYSARSFNNVDILIGGKTATEAELWNREFEGSVDEMFIATDDGSAGVKGFVTELLPEVLSKKNYNAILTCGPLVMMRGVASIARDKNIRCEVSMERRMACGLGACLSCSIDTVDGRKKVCKDGPIFDANKIIW